MPTRRQFLLLAALWAAVGWLCSAAWGMYDQRLGFADAAVAYYAVRAPFVGVLIGLAWAPILCMHPLPGRASGMAGRAAGLAVEAPTRRIARFVQGVVVGTLIGPSGTTLTLLIWPNDVQNTRWDAFRWGAFIWYADWPVFVPIGTVAGLLSVWVAVRAGGRR